MFGIRAIIIAFLGLTGSGVSLFRPYFGMLMLAVMYFFRPDLYGAEDYVQPVKWLTIAILLGYLATGWSQAANAARVPRLSPSPGRGRVRRPVANRTAARANNTRLAVAPKDPASTDLPAIADAPAPGMFAGNGWIAMFLGLYIVSTVFAPMTNSDSWDRLWLIVKIFIAVFLIDKVCNTPARLAGFVMAMVLGSCWFLKVTIVAWAFYGWSDVRIDSEAGQGGGANYIAWCLSAMMGFVYYKAMKGRSWQRLTAIALIPLFVIGNMATGSRGGLLCVGAASIMFLVLMRRWTLLVAGAVGVMLFLTFAPATYMERMATITTDPAKMDVSSLARYQNMQMGKQIILDYPIFGTGLETFPLAKRAYMKPDYVGGWFHVAHNTFIQLGSECGVPMLLAFGAVSVVATKRLLGRRTFADARDEDNMNWVRVGTLCALAATWTEMVKGDIAHNDLFWWIYGLAFTYHHIVKRMAVQPATRVTRRPGRAGAAVGKLMPRRETAVLGGDLR